MVEVTEENLASWLDFLSREHGSDVSSIRGQVVQVEKDTFTKTVLWKELSVEQLSQLHTFMASITKGL
jgi:hypothetical protein